MKDDKIQSKRPISADERNKLIYWVWLANACGAGSTAGSTLLSRFPGGPQEIYAVDFTKRRFDGIKPEIAEKLNEKELDEATKIVDWCIENGVQIVTLAHRSYPPLLKQILSRPVLFYCKGTLPDFSAAFCVAMVGTRTMSDYGAEQAYRMANALTSCGAIVVSGMAKGIDTRSHWGALDAGGVTVAVLGCGIDRTYPSENKTLMDRIIAHGAVITEFAPGTPPTGSNFPIRNRIISGLCQATLVVEASAKSGALITARTAEQQGRDVYAIPGKIGEAGSDGVNRLLAGEKGRLVVTAQDLLSHYVTKYPHIIDLSKNPTYVSGRVSPLRETRVASRPVNEKHFYQNEPSSGPATDIRDFKRIERVEADITDDYFENPELTGMVEAHREMQKQQQKPKSVKKELPPLENLEQKVYDRMPEGDSVTADELSGDDIPIYHVILSLTMLETKGYVQALPGGYYQKL